MTLIRWWIVLLPWVFVPGVLSPFIHPKEAMFQIGAVAVLAMTLFRGYPARRVWKNHWVAWGLCYLVAHVAWEFWIPFITAKPTTIIFHWYTLRVSANIVLGCLVTWVLVTRYLSEIQYLSKLINWLCYSCMAIAGFAILQYIGFDPIFVGDHTTNIFVWSDTTRFDSRLMFGMFGNVSELACYLAVHVPLFFTFKEKRFLVGLALVLSAIYLTGISYAWLATCAGLTVYGFCRWMTYQPQLRVVQQTIAVCGVALLFITGWSNQTQLTQDERWPIWKDVAQHLTWLGHGPGQFTIDYKVKWDETKTRIQGLRTDMPFAYAHNEPLQAGYDFGLIGWGFMALIFASAFSRIRKRWDSIIGAAALGCGASFAVVSGTHITWHMAPMAVAGIVIWALWETEELA